MHTVIFPVEVIGDLRGQGLEGLGSSLVVHKVDFGTSIVVDMV